MLKWQDIGGQTRAKEVLENARNSDRLHHAYLLVGPSGIGKRATALAFAAALNCTGHDASEFVPACGACPSCRKISTNQHPDVRIVEAEGKRIKIAQIREILRSANSRPYEGRYQFVIIDDAHKMGDEAANALLKTLEEPPPTMKLMLVTDQPAALLDTIRSRCQLLRFAPLEDALVTTILSAEFPDEDPGALAVAAGFGEGSVGRAKELAESGLLPERRELIQTLLEVEPNQTARLIKAAESLTQDRAQFMTKLEILKVFLRDVALLHAVPEDSQRLINTDLVEYAHRWGREVALDDVLKHIERVTHAQFLLDRNVNPMMIAEDLLMDLAAR